MRTLEESIQSIKDMKPMNRQQICAVASMASTLNRLGCTKEFIFISLCNMVIYMQLKDSEFPEGVFEEVEELQNKEGAYKSIFSLVEGL